MFPPFSETLAFEKCRKLIDALKDGKAEMVQITCESEERHDHGVMLGCAVCRDSMKNEILLFTLSGISRELKFNNAINECFPDEKIIFVPPIVSSLKVNEALKKNDAKIHELTEKINELKSERKLENGKYKNQTEEEKKLNEERTKLTSESLNEFFNLYSFNLFDGTKRSLFDICKDKLPPTGTGDCCAPKLIDYAFSKNLSILSMCEVFYGKNTNTKISGNKYSPCDERCSLILPEMLGLEIVYRDEHIIVVNKQSGLLSVPGRGPDKQDCIVSRVKKLFPDCISQPSVHRLDMETSGLLVLAFKEDAHRELNRQFENKEIYKEYEALLDGEIAEEQGEMELYFRVDLDNRPHQIWDEVYGKKAITRWKKLGVEDYISPDGNKKKVTRLNFLPLTGRTHQLRLASADIHGLNHPIIGDTLYGECLEGERLLLHSTVLEFTHPYTKEIMRFTSKAPF